MSSRGAMVQGSGERVRRTEGVSTSCAETAGPIRATRHLACRRVRVCAARFVSITRSGSALGSLERCRSRLAHDGHAQETGMLVGLSFASFCQQTGMGVSRAL
eukprot:3054609-Pleurochrysis_carterae.AAC.1